MLALVLVAVSVGVGNFAASAALGVSGVPSRLRLRVAVIFGLFEAGMPLVGILLGDSLVSGRASHVNVIAGVVLAAAGVYALVEGERGKHEATDEAAEPSMGRLVVLAAALSIDNLAVGFALGARHVAPVVAALVIGVVSVGLTLLGLEVGERLGARLGHWAARVGAALLVFVGIAVGTGLF